MINCVVVIAIKTIINRYLISSSMRKCPTFCDAINSFPAKLRLRKENRISVLFSQTSFPGEAVFGEISAVFLSYIKGSICTLKFSFLELSYNYKSSENLLKSSY